MVPIKYKVKVGCYQISSISFTANIEHPNYLSANATNISVKLRKELKTVQLNDLITISTNEMGCGAYKIEGFTSSSMSTSYR